MTNFRKVTIIGTGAFGTALGNVLSDNGHDVINYGIDQNEITDINVRHVNSKYFKNLKINKNLKATDNLELAIENSEFIITAVPTFVLETVVKKIGSILKKPIVLVNASKGLEASTGKIMSEVLPIIISKEKLNGYGGIYGPSIASEVVLRNKTCMNAVSRDLKIAKDIKNLFNNEYFLTFESLKITHIEYSAALKNVIAIAAGISDGIFDSDNLTSSIITMGLNEIVTLANFKEKKQDNDIDSNNQFKEELKEMTMNYAEIGDLILTTKSPKSRNYRFGKEISVTKNIKEAELNIGKTVEGLATIKSLYNDIKNLRSNYDVSLPLFDCIYNILVHEVKAEKIFEIIGKKPFINKLISRVTRNKK